MNIVLCPSKEISIKHMSLIPYQSGQQAVIRVFKNNGSPDRVSAIMSSGAVKFIHYRSNGYDITNNSLLAGISFISPSKGKIKNLAIQCVSSNNAGNIGVMDIPPGEILKLHFQLYSTTNINDYKLKPIQNSKITFTHTGPYNFGHVFGNANITLDEDIEPGSQIALMFWGELSTGLTSVQNNTGYFAVMGGMNITQDD